MGRRNLTLMWWGIGMLNVACNLTFKFDPVSHLVGFTFGSFIFGLAIYIDAKYPRPIKRAPHE